MRAWALGCFHSLISTQTFRRALTASVDSCAEIRVPLQWRNQIWQSLEEDAGKRCSECGREVDWHNLSPVSHDLCRHQFVLLCHYSAVFIMCSQAWAFFLQAKREG